jgi:GNAT superfamily N-acetyltransferase
MDDLIISFSPTTEHLNNIKQWLIAEDLNNDGFFCNWNVIKSSFDQKHMAVILNRNIPIGYSIWNDIEPVVTLDIVEVKHGLRRKGYGKILINAVTNFFQTKGVKVIKVHCQPSSSEKVWKKLGFIQFPIASAFDDFNAKHSKHLYKIIEQPLEMTKEFGVGDEVIELWDDEKFLITEQKPTWVWKLKCKVNSSELLRPIIFPCHPDWRIRWRIGDRVFIDETVKYFSNVSIRYGSFMIIHSLPTIKF